VEEAHGYAQLMAANRWNGKQVADALRVPASRVSRALALLKLPEDVQRQIDAGEVAARTGYELSKLPEDDQIRQLSQRAAHGKLTHQQAARAVKSRTGKGRHKPTRGTQLTFVVGHGWRVSVAGKSRDNYHEVEQALTEALDEVRHRIQNNVQLY